MLSNAADANGRLGQLPGFLVGDVKDVARQGFEACMKGQAVCVPGVLNRARHDRLARHAQMAGAPAGRHHGAPGAVRTWQPPATKREYDVVLYGASGFVGRQTVAYFARPAATRPAPPALGAGRAQRQQTARGERCLWGPIGPAWWWPTLKMSARWTRWRAARPVVLSTAGPVRALWQRAAGRLRAPRHPLCGHHRRNALGARHDRAAP